VKTVYSPLDAVELARSAPDTEVVFLGVGFETTAPTLAASIMSAAREGLTNYSILSAAKTIPSALRTLAGSEDLHLDGFLLPGHVSIVLGVQVYEDLPREHGLACAVAGFEPAEMLRGLVSLVDQVDRGAPRVHNCYPGAVRTEGNPKARAVMERVFATVDSEWRGLGVVPTSGLDIREDLAAYDAARKFAVELPPPVEPVGCRCGEVLKGSIEPEECGLFGEACTPLRPQGACMVSSEGACAARYNFGEGGGT
jgi:hydrogenase expression/formation protein HypD